MASYTPKQGKRMLEVLYERGSRVTLAIRSVSHQSKVDTWAAVGILDRNGTKTRASYAAWSRAIPP